MFYLPFLIVGLLIGAYLSNRDANRRHRAAMGPANPKSIFANQAKHWWD
jgi:hypothetical protein